MTEPMVNPVTIQPKVRISPAMVRKCLEHYECALTDDNVKDVIEDVQDNLVGYIDLDDIIAASVEAMKSDGDLEVEEEDEEDEEGK